MTAVQTCALPSVSRDGPVVRGVVLFAALAYVLVTLVTDLVIARVVPRTEARLEAVVSHV